MSFNKLVVYLNGEKVGKLVLDQDSDDLSLLYFDSWVNNGFEISPSLPFGEEIKSTSIKRFLENLFPEGSALEDLKEQFRVGISNTFAVTKIIGKETTGALSFLSEDDVINYKSSFREITSSELAIRLDERSSRGIAIWDEKMRLSIAGVQDKLPVTILSDGRIGLGDGDIASTHILKFQREDRKIPYLVLNEFFCMSLAKSVGIEVPEVSYRRFGNNPALLVKRFDRHIESDIKVNKSHIIDGCQALNLLSTYRYERNFGSSRDVLNVREGASLNKLFKLTLKCDVPALNQLKLLNWMLFNLLIYNSDAHGKNISFFIDKKGMRIAPFYDLVNILIYPDLDNELAMSIGDEFDPSQIYAFQLAEFCNKNGIKKKLLENQFRMLCKKVKLAIDKISLPTLTDSELEFLQKMKGSILERLQHYGATIGEISKMD